jgi:hypothetical protein
LPGTTLAWLAAPGAGNVLKGHLQAMRDQFRSRIHVCEIKAAALPAIGSQGTADEQMRLAEGLNAIVVLPLPRLPPPLSLTPPAQLNLPRQPRPRRST